MRNGTAAALVFLMVAGCAGAPAFTHADYVETEEILRAVERELCTAVAWVDDTPEVQARVLAAGLDIRQFVASATVGLSVIAQTNAAGDTSLVVPVNYGVAGLSASLGTRVARTRETVLKVYYPFNELECTGDKARPGRRIAGNLGLADWIKQTTNILINVREVPVAYSYSVSFDLTNQAGIGPMFQIVPHDKSISGGAQLGAAREIVNSLSVTVVEIRPDADLAARYRLPDETRRRLERESDIQAIRESNR